MTWRERRHKLEAAIDRLMVQLDLVPTGDYKDDANIAIMLNALTDAARDARFEHEREEESRAFYDLRREMREVLHDLPETIVMPRDTPFQMTDDIAAIIRCGQRLRDELDRLDRIDI